MTATAMKALDLFCSAGGATRGLTRAGFAVTGVDARPQPRYCGDAFVPADAVADAALIEAMPISSGVSKQVRWLLLFRIGVEKLIDAETCRRGPRPKAREAIVH